MTFENCRDNAIKNFILDCYACDTLDKDCDIDNVYINKIKNALESHRECFKNGLFDNVNPKDIIVNCVYGGINASIECTECNSVIIDDESLFDDDYK